MTRGSIAYFDQRSELDTRITPNSKLKTICNLSGDVRKMYGCDHFHLSNVR